MQNLLLIQFNIQHLLKKKNNEKYILNYLNIVTCLTYNKFNKMNFRIFARSNSY